MPIGITVALSTADFLPVPRHSFLLQTDQSQPMINPHSFSPSRGRRLALFASTTFLTLAAVGGTLAQASSGIFSLSNANSSVIEHAFASGDDRGGIAVSSTSVFYTGDGGTGRFDKANLGNGALIGDGTQYDALASNIRTGTVYTLADDNGPLPYGGGTVTRLMTIDGTTGQLTGSSLTLSTPVVMGVPAMKAMGSSSSGIFSGWDRIVLLDGISSSGFNIDLPTGTVTPIGFVDLPSTGFAGSRYPCESWATWGVAEFTSGSIKLAYVSQTDGGIPRLGFAGGEIRRYDVASGTSSLIASFPDGLSDMCSFTVDPSQNRWYFHYEGYSGAFAFGNDENIGFASASFLAPTAAAVELGGAVRTSGGLPISNATLTLTDVETGAVRVTRTGSMGLYRFDNVRVGNGYTVSVSAKRNQFSNATQFVNLTDQLMNVDFEAR
jgi:hypothetical protein